MSSQVPEWDGMQHTGPASPGSVTPEPSDPGTREPTGMPRWVKVFGLVTAVVAVLVVVMLLIGHGPGRHGG